MVAWWVTISGKHSGIPAIRQNHMPSHATSLGLFAWRNLDGLAECWRNLWEKNTVSDKKRSGSSRVQRHANGAMMKSSPIKWSNISFQKKLSNILCFVKLRQYHVINQIFLKKCNKSNSYSIIKHHFPSNLLLRSENYTWRSLLRSLLWRRSPPLGPSVLSLTFCKSQQTVAAYSIRSKL